jgi:hypothetical protein
MSTFDGETRGGLSIHQAKRPHLLYGTSGVDDSHEMLSKKDFFLSYDGGAAGAPDPPSSPATAAAEGAAAGGGADTESFSKAWAAVAKSNSPSSFFTSPVT